MEFYYQYLSSGGGGGGGGSAKEKRPPLKRGQLKRQIVRTISNLMRVPPGGDGGGPNQAAEREFRREPSNN